MSQVAIGNDLITSSWPFHVKYVSHWVHGKLSFPFYMLELMRASQSSAYVLFSGSYCVQFTFSACTIASTVGCMVKTALMHKYFNMTEFNSVNSSCFMTLVGSRVNSGKPSSEFQSLLDGLLEKDSKKRIAWPQLVVHPFWQGELSHLTVDDMTTQSDVRQSFRQSVANFPLQMSMAAGDDASKTNIGQQTGRERTPDETDGQLQDNTNGQSNAMSSKLFNYLY